MQNGFVLNNSNKLLLAAAFVALVLIYYISMPKTVALEDDGYFILSAFYNGVSHPPGYPLFSLLSHLVTLLPFGVVAVKVHMVSAVFGALASTLAGIIIFQIYGNITLSILSVFIVGMGQGFWSQAIISEVYTLNAFFVFLLILITLKLNTLLLSQKTENINDKEVSIYVFYLSLCVALGLTNHWPLFILGGISCSVILIPLLKCKKFFLGKMLIGFSIGLLPFVWLVINSVRDPFVNFSGPFASYIEVYDFVSRKYYDKGIDFNASAGMLDKIYFVFYSIKISLYEHSHLGFLFVLVGVFYLFKNKLDFTLKILISCFLITLLLLPMLLSYSYTYWYQIIYRPYLLISYSLSGLFLSAGIYHIASKYKEKNRLLIGLSIIVVASGIYFTGGKNVRHDYDFSMDYALTVLNSLDKNSVIFVAGDVETGTLSYARYVLNLRPDIDIYHRNGLFFNTRLFDPRYNSLIDKKNKILEFTISSNRPIYFTYLQKGLGLENHWLYYKYNKKININEQKLFDISKHSDFLFRVLSDNKEQTDDWSKVFNERLRFAVLPGLFMKLINNNNPEVQNAYKDIIYSLFYDFSNFLYAIQLIKRFSLYEIFGGNTELIKVGDKLFQFELDKTKRASYLNYKAENSILLGDYNEAVEFYAASVNELNTQKNVAVAKLNILCEKESSLLNNSICHDI